MRGEADALERHAARRGVRFSEVFESDGNEWSGRKTHLFELYTVTHGRWCARASMPDRHDHGVAAGLDLGVQLGIIIGECSGLQPVLGFHAGHVLLKPQPHLSEEMIRARKTVRDQKNRLAVQ